jgi:hypothetical protein
MLITRIEWAAAQSVAQKMIFEMVQGVDNGDVALASYREDSHPDFVWIEEGVDSALVDILGSGAASAATITAPRAASCSPGCDRHTACSRPHGGSTGRAV